MEDTLKERTKELDMLLLVLRRNCYRKYYTIDSLRRKIPSLRVWSERDLQENFKLLSGNLEFGKTHNLSPLQITYKNGEERYRFNPAEKKRLKIIKKIVYGLKTDDEIRELKEKELRFKKLARDVYFYRDPVFG